MSRNESIQEKIDLQIIRYSQCWEDPACLIGSLHINEDDDVLSITSGGCNTLALLLEGPRSVTALDFNPLQSFFLYLKMAAIQALDYQDFLEFLGVRESGKRGAYYEKLRPHLHEDARDWWDRNQETIHKGVIRVGRYDQYLALFRQRVLPRIHSPKRIREALRPKSLSEQKDFYSRIWNNRRWRLTFRFFFGKTLLGRLGRDPAFFKYVKTQNVGENFLKRTEHVFTEIPLDTNYFVEYILTGEFRDPNKAHPYLWERNYLRLRELLPRLRVVNAPLREFLNGQPEGSFSKYNLSDSFEWMSQEEYESHLKAIVRSSRKDGRIAYWNLLVPRSHPDSMNDLFSLEQDLSESLLFQDRAFVYGRFVVERVLK